MRKNLRFSRAQLQKSVMINDLKKSIIQRNVIYESTEKGHLMAGEIGDQEHLPRRGDD